MGLKWNENGKIKNKPRLMHIYNSFGYPTLILGYPAAVARMLIIQYGDAGLTKLRVL